MSRIFLVGVVLATLARPPVAWSQEPPSLDPAPSSSDSVPLVGSLDRGLDRELDLALDVALEDAEVRRLAETVLEQSGYQRELPEDGGEEQRWMWLQWLLELLSVGLGDFLLIAMAIAAAALLIFWIVATLRGRSWRESADEEPTALSRPAGPLLVRPVDLEEAQAAAARGAYGEAVHLLLLHSLGRLGLHQPKAVAKARTSREVLGRVRLPPLAHEALETLVVKTESWLFGGRDLQQADYLGCLEASRVLKETVQAEGRRA